MIRISILRILATLTHAAESCGVTNAEIESFLRIAYTASYKIRQPEGRLAPFELISYAERNVQNAERPECAHLFHSDIGPPHRIAKESVLGPTALARLLVVLAQRGTLDTIQGLKKAPSGLSSCTSLAHVQQITHPDIIRRFLTIALDRVNACIEQGRLDVKVNQFYSAQVSFTSSAELAAALMALDTHTKGQYSKEIQGARKQLVIALGNASQMALNQEKSLEALSFGHGALSAAENIPASEGLHQNIVEKIKLRIQKAQESMQKS
ncbi:hypothetical protein ID866_6224 [Astraeus odoratus]|nr:hypothetical protein ID866_6224 [Astraeus odoratus]